MPEVYKNSDLLPGVKKVSDNALKELPGKPVDKSGIVRIDGDRKPYQASELMPGATELPRGAEYSEDAGGGRNLDFNHNVSFPAFRDGQILNNEAQSLMDSQSVTTNALGAVPTGQYQPVPQAQQLPARTPEAQANIDKLAQAAPAAVPASTSPAPKSRKRRKKKDEPVEPQVILQFTGSFGSMEVSCHRLIIGSEFIVIVHDSSWRGMKWKPKPISLDDPDPEIFTVIPVSGYEGAWPSTVLQVYYCGLSFQDQTAGAEYTVFNIAY